MSILLTDIENQLNSLLQELPNPSGISSSLSSIQQQYTSVLDDFKKYYVLHYQYPDLNEYTQMFASVKGNLHNLNSQLFSQKNNVESGLQQLGQLMTQINDSINDEKNIQTELKQQLEIVKAENNGSTEMTKNYNTMYHLQYFSNTTMFFGILIVLYVTYKVFQKKG